MNNWVFPSSPKSVAKLMSSSHDGDAFILEKYLLGFFFATILLSGFARGARRQQQQFPKGNRVCVGPAKRSQFLTKTSTRSGSSPIYL